MIEIAGRIVNCLDMLSCLMNNDPVTKWYVLRRTLTQVVSVIEAI